MRDSVLLSLAVAMLAAGPALADDETPPVVGGKTYVQHQILAARASHPGVAAITVVGSNADGKGQFVLGSTRNAALVLKPAAAGSDGVQQNGAQTTIREAFNSSSGHRLGTIEIIFVGGTPAANQRTAAAIQAGMARATLSAKNAADPWPFDQAWSPDSYAQVLTTKTIARYPELLVMMIHATPPGRTGNVIIGSNIGRFGKAADADDLRVIDKGATNLELGGDQDRFETELPLNDAKGNRIGAFGLVFLFKPGADKEALHRRGIAIRDEVAAAIPSSAALFAPGSTAKASLTLSGSTDFPGYTGDFDHFAIDDRSGTLFLAGEESAELEVMDLATGHIKSRIKGFGVPHSLHFTPATHELLVIDGEKPSPVYDTATMKVKRRYALPKGADSFGFDAGSGHLWIVTGGKDVPQPDSNLIEFDPATGKTIKSLHFDADHVEAMAIEQHGPKLYINVTDKNYLATVDKVTGKVVKQWQIREAEQNAPIAFDEKTRRLFVVTRKPGKLLVLNADTGATVAAFTAPARTDQVTWDAANRRIYVTGGEGYIGVIEQDGPDRYREAARIPSLAGAKTAILDPVRHHLWVAASPGETKAMAKVLRYDVAPR